MKICVRAYFKALARERLKRRILNNFFKPPRARKIIADKDIVCYQILIADGGYINCVKYPIGKLMPEREVYRVGGIAYGAYWMYMDENIAMSHLWEADVERRRTGLDDPISADDIHKFIIPKGTLCYYTPTRGEYVAATVKRIS